MSVPGYYTHYRQEIFPLLPDRIGSLLEIGCGAGVMAQAIREQYSPDWVGGVELDPQAAQLARQHFDAVWTMDIERADLPLEAGSQDVVLCLDVLEHLVDPWRVVEKLSGLIRPGGCLIASIPNIRHYKVLGALLFRGEFEYSDAGILDRTHLRFFVRRSAAALLASSGMSVDRVEMTGIKPRTLKWFMSRVLPAGMKDMLALQFIIRAVRQA